MQLYYTGARIAEGVQIDPFLSLGGYKSSTPLPNGDLGNLFPAITRTAAASGRKDIRMVVLKNTTASTITGLRIWTVSEKYSKVKIAAVAPVTGTVLFEEVPSSSAIPYQAALSSCELEVNALEVGDLLKDGVIGVWIQRELDPTKFTDYEKGITPDLTDGAKAEAYIAELKNKTTENDEIEVIFDWD